MKSSSGIYHIVSRGINKQKILSKWELLKILRTKVISPEDVQSFELEKRNKAIKKMKEQGLSIRQLERLTGISFGIIRGL